MINKLITLTCSAIIASVLHSGSAFAGGSASASGSASSDFQILSVRAAPSIRSVRVKWRYDGPELASKCRLTGKARVDLKQFSGVETEELRLMSSKRHRMRTGRVYYDFLEFTTFFSATRVRSISLSYDCGLDGRSDLPTHYISGSQSSSSGVKSSSASHDNPSVKSRYFRIRKARAFERSRKLHLTWKYYGPELSRKCRLSGKARVRKTLRNGDSRISEVPLLGFKTRSMRRGSSHFEVLSLPGSIPITKVFHVDLSYNCGRAGKGDLPVRPIY